MIAVQKMDKVSPTTHVEKSMSEKHCIRMNFNFAALRDFCTICNRVFKVDNIRTW
jgi:hypothetical protein